MALQKILDDYVLKFYEIFPNTPGKRDKEISRDEFALIIGDEAFGEIIKWEDKKQVGVCFNIESVNLKKAKHDI